MKPIMDQNLCKQNNNIEITFYHYNIRPGCGSGRSSSISLSSLLSSDEVEGAPTVKPYKE